MKQQLLNAIQALADELVKNGKLKTVEFFFKARTSINSECGGHHEELTNLLDQIQRSGSMIQYANFTAKEEDLWDEVYAAAKEWRASMK